MNRIYNFSPGPATLPLEVLQEVQAEFLDYQGLGMSIVEMSHRSKTYDAINAEVEREFKELLNLGDAYRVLFLQGGATLQFSMLPLNFLGSGQTADYILTGGWAEKALAEAKKVGATHVADITSDTVIATPATRANRRKTGTSARDAPSWPASQKVHARPHPSGNAASKLKCGCRLAATLTPITPARTTPASPAGPTPRQPRACVHVSRNTGTSSNACE